MSPIISIKSSIVEKDPNDEGIGGLALFSELLENQSFRDEFIQRSAHYLNSIFEPDRISGLIDSFSTSIMQEMPRHIIENYQKYKLWLD